MLGALAGVPLVRGGATVVISRRPVSSGRSGSSIDPEYRGTRGLDGETWAQTRRVRREAALRELGEL